MSLYTLDIGLLQAGASMKGEFENRLRQVIDEVQASPKPIILFIDEAHTLIGAGGAAGTGDAANLLKPALARGTLRTIAATTWAEYKKYIEKDPALTRRFQVVQVEEPSEDKAMLMVRGVASMLEKHHRVQLLDEALEAAVRLSHRYIPGAPAARQGGQPARHRVRARRRSASTRVPPQLEDCRRTIEALRDRDGDHRPRGGGRHRRRRAAAGRARRSCGGRTRQSALEARRQRWNAERGARRAACSAIRAQAAGAATPAGGRGTRQPRLEQAAESQTARLRPAVAPAPAGAASERRPAADGRRRRTATLLAELARSAGASSRTLQGDSPLILPSVDEQAVAIGGPGLDRRAGRPDGEERDRDAC